jgi:hypothetical protein
MAVTFALLCVRRLRALVLKHLAPGLGCIIAFIMFFSPFQAVQAVRASGRLGDLNALPLVAIIANCLVGVPARHERRAHYTARPAARLACDERDLQSGHLFNRCGSSTGPSQETSTSSARTSLGSCWACT